MMTEVQYILCKLAEEAGELAQIAMKAQQFGLDETYIDESNADRLIKEFIDVMGVISLLQGRGYTRVVSEEEMQAGIEAKINKMIEYCGYSIDCGQVVPREEWPNIIRDTSES